MKTIILKNNTPSEIELSNLGGLVLDASSTRDISELTFDIIVNADDLRDAVASGTITVNDGSLDLPAERALTYVSYEDAAYIQGIPVVRPEYATLSGGFTMRYEADQEDWIYDTFRLSELGDVVVDEETGQYTVANPTGSGVLVPVVPPDEFTELLDTPTTYSGSEDLYVKVNSTADGLEFATVSGAAAPDCISKYVTTVSVWTYDSGLYYADITHSLETKDVIVETTVNDLTVGMENIDRISDDVVRIWSATNTDDVRVVVMGSNCMVSVMDHTIQSHTDTNATGAQLDELVGGGSTSLHTHTITDIEEEYIIYVGKHGADVNDGRNIGNAVLTFGKALELIYAQSPSASNIWGIECSDAGIYNEDITISGAYVHVFASNATLEGNISMVGRSSVEFEKVKSTTGTAIKLTGGSCTGFVQVKRLEIDGATVGIQNTDSNSMLNVEIEYFRQTNGIGMGGSGSAGIVHADIQDWDMYGTSTAVQAASGSGMMNLRAANVSDRGSGTTVAFDCNAATTNAMVLYADVDTLYDVESGATLNLMGANLNGSTYNNGTVNISEAGGVSSHSHTESDITDLGSYLENVVEDTSPQLGGDLDLNGNNIDYGTVITVNGTYRGEIMTVDVDDAGAAFGKPLAIAADFDYDLADADSATNAKGIVMALESGTGAKKVLLKGQICNTSWNWAAGQVYLSTTAGNMTQTAPSGTGDQAIALGWALSADTIFFRPSLVLVEAE